MVLLNQYLLLHFKPINQIIGGDVGLVRKRNKFLKKKRTPKEEGQRCPIQ